ncbi:sulfate transporter family-domain-containing protein [Dichotomocladium elegans]|nr:sulfate transporter family-domain-containing protein [Dichotomocladium elegans]
MDPPIILDYESATLRDRSRNFVQKLPSHARHYISSFFPVFQWITRYNSAWMTQDIIAGMTVGMMLVPQGIAYAKVASLDPQYGLYASFVGSCFYFIFGTSKDISIGPITVVSLLVGNAIASVSATHPDITGPEVAVYLCVVTGVICILIGMIRLGFLVDFIPEPAIAGYMTGSAITISLGQWGKLVGMKLNTRQAPYLIIADFLSGLSGIHIDAAFGVPSLVALYVIRSLAAKLGARYPKYKKPLFYLGIMRSSVILIVGTFISFLVNMGKEKSPFSILKNVPAGFDAMGVPRMDIDILGDISGVLPSIVLIMVLEHVSVAKSFGRMSDYVIDPNQEIMAIGVTNLAGAFFGAYPGTGAFSRTAIMSRSGAKTPLSSGFSATVVALALYVLTPAFYYIPDALLAAVVIHAVTDLVSGMKYIRELWHVSKLEFMVFAAAVSITFFDGVEDGIYVAIALSLFIVLVNLARPKVTVLARSPLTKDDSHAIYVDEKDPHFLNAARPITSGLIVIRLTSALLYPNAGYVCESIVECAKARTRRGQQEQEQQGAAESGLWTQGTDDGKKTHLPVLDAIVLDCAALSRIDATALQTLVSARDLLDRYAGHTVEWHFAGVVSKQVRNDLVLYGFGSLPEAEPGTDENIAYYDAANVSRSTTLKEDEEDRGSSKEDSTCNKGSEKVLDQKQYECSHGVASTGDYPSSEDMVDMYYMDQSQYTRIIVDPHQNLPRDRYPAFHWDIDSAVKSIVDRHAIHRV